MTGELSLVDQVMEFAQTRQVAMPVSNDVALTVQSVARSEPCDARRIVRAIETDPVLVAELLRHANSAFFGGLSEIDSIQGAVTRLGTQRVTHLVLLATEKGRYAARHPRVAPLMTQLWHHASATALASDWIARRARYTNLGEVVFVGGLIHDIGKLFLLRTLDEMAMGQRADGAISIELILEVLDHAHTHVGRGLVESWQLPSVYRTIVGTHHDEPADTANIALQIVRLANHAANQVGIGLRGPGGVAASDTPEAAALGLNEVAIAELEIILEDSRTLPVGP